MKSAAHITALAVCFQISMLLVGFGFWSAFAGAAAFVITMVTFEEVGKGR